MLFAQPYLSRSTLVWVYVVVVQFYPWFKFYFPLFLGMVMCDNEFKKKENEFEPRKKLNHNVHTAPTKGQITKFSLCKCLN